MKEEDEKFLQELKTMIKYKHLLQVLANAMLEDKHVYFLSTLRSIRIPNLQ